MSVEQRLDRLEREARWWRRVGLGAVLVAAFAAGSATSVPPNADQAEASLRLYSIMQGDAQKTAARFPPLITGAPRDGCFLVVTPSGVARIIFGDGSFVPVKGVGSIHPKIGGEYAVGDEPKSREYNFRTNMFEAYTNDFTPPDSKSADVTTEGSNK